MRENDKLTLVQVLDVVIKRCEASAEEFLETAPEFLLGFGFLGFFFHFSFTLRKYVTRIISFVCISKLTVTVTDRESPSVECGISLISCSGVQGVLV